MIIRVLLAISVVFIDFLIQFIVKKKINFNLKALLNTMVIIPVFLIDQIVKIWVKTSVEPKISVPVIQDFFHITYAENKGMAFGLFQDNVLALGGIGILATIAIILYIHKKDEEHSMIGRLGLLFVLGGALGNVYDRVFLGYVVDFMDFRGIWPYIFNIADVAINVGALLLLLEFFIEKERLKKEEKGNDSSRDDISTSEFLEQ